MRHSESQGEIGPALVGALSDLTNPERTAVNPFFKSKYAPLHATLDLVRAAMAPHGLAVMQSAVSHEGFVGVMTRVIHTSGEWVESEPLLLKPAKDDPQGGGSAVTYARRYSIEAMLGICGEVDDDGNAATKGKGKKDKPKPAGKPADKPAAKPSEPGDAPVCPECGAIMELRTVQKSGKNQGKKFFGCPEKDASGEWCKGFLWLTDWQTRQARLAGEKDGDPANDDHADELPDSRIPF